MSVPCGLLCFSGRVLLVRRYLPATGNINDKSYKVFREYLSLFAILDRVAVTVHLNYTLKPRSSVLQPEKPLSNFDHLTSVHISCCSVFPVSNFDLRNMFSYLLRYKEKGSRLFKNYFTAKMKRDLSG